MFQISLHILVATTRNSQDLGDASILADKGPFDMVIANINRNILLADMQHYVARMNEGATLLMSGFYVDDIPLIKAEAERLGLTSNL